MSGSLPNSPCTIKGGESSLSPRIAGESFLASPLHRLYRRSSASRKAQTLTSASHHWKWPSTIGRRTHIAAASARLRWLLCINRVSLSPVTHADNRSSHSSEHQRWGLGTLCVIRRWDLRSMFVRAVQLHDFRKYKGGPCPSHPAGCCSCGSLRQSRT